MRRDLCWMDEIKMHGTTLKSKLGYKLEVLGLCVCMCVCSLISFMLSTLAFIIINFLNVSSNISTLPKPSGNKKKSKI